MKQIRKRLTYANVMSSIAVFLVLGGGAAVAANQLGKNSIGKKQLKPNSVTTTKIKRNAVTANKIAKNAVNGAKVKDGSLNGTDINLNTLGTVPSANTANTAKTAQSLAYATQLKLTKVASSASAANTEAARAAASIVPLYEDSHFQIYAKCFIDNSVPELIGSVYIASKQNGAIFEGDDNEVNGNTELLNTNTEEQNRDLIFVTTGLNEAEMQYEGDNEFGATASDGYSIQGVWQIAVKQGTTAVGDGPYGPGNICLFSGYVLHS